MCTYIIGQGEYDYLSLKRYGWNNNQSKSNESKTNAVFVAYLGSFFVLFAASLSAAQHLTLPVPSPQSLWHEGSGRDARQMDEGGTWDGVYWY